MAASFSVDDRQLSKLMERMRKVSPRVDEEMAQVQEEGAQLLHDTLVAHASGRPGPNIRTGAYVASFYVQRMAKGFRVGNNSPQARRLEYGFIGQDSLGRNYSQPPFPHFRPAIIEFRPQYRRMVAGVPKKVWRGL
jgi:hypothetical protein